MSGGSRKLLDLPWRRLLAESVVIVVGVAVGLAVDSAREARSDAERAVDHLQQIRAELAGGSAKIDEQITRKHSMSAAAQQLLEGINQPTLPPLDSLRAWWSSPFSLGAYRPSTVAIDALVESGDLRLIRDSELRQAIMAYREQAQTSETASVTADGLASRAVARIGEAMSLANLSIGPAETRLPLDWEAAAADPAFQSQVQVTWVGASSTATQLRVLHGATEDLMSLIDSALR